MIPAIVVFVYLGAVLAIGLVGLEFARRTFIRVWGRAQEEIEAEVRAREPA